MRGDDGPGAPVRVNAGDGRLRIDAGEDQIGDWDIHEIGIKAIPEGFSIRAEGEEFVLRSDDEVALADEFHLAAATPRLARKVAAAHNPQIPPDPPGEEVFPEGSSLVAASAFAWAGVLAISKFQYSAVEKSISFTSKPGIYFWSNGYSWGTCEVKSKEAVLKVLFGEVELEKFSLDGVGTKNFKSIRVNSSETLNIKL